MLAPDFSPPCFLGGEVIIREPFDAPTDAPIEYETVTYFSEPEGSKYFGQSNNQTDAAWDGLLTNGPESSGYRTTQHRNCLSRRKRVRDYERKINPDVPGYMGNIEVFHQLHCLNRIRKLFYNQTRSDVHDEIPEMREPHTMHCFEYLRQVLQCHGDVGIMSLGWDAEGESYTAIFETKRQCRNFERIREWTREHQVLTFLPTNELNATAFGEEEEGDKSSLTEPIRSQVNIQSRLGGPPDSSTRNPFRLELYTDISNRDVRYVVRGSVSEKGGRLTSRSDSEKRNATAESGGGRDDAAWGNLAVVQESTSPPYEEMYTT
ncbi:hypothetical protein DL98DRAFT_566246 [Cadophora sp. DSE1049]|nr:hypothetical protein DL98DRAFT_566246 [Cadophora sp. DSE1049]